jgi:hypothetical protein
MMASSRRIPVFWRRSVPRARFDLKKLRPGSLPRGRRFETQSDAAKESRRSEKLLDRQQSGAQYGVYLRECRGGDYDCDQPYCPKCGRVFRRYFAGELLRLSEGVDGEIVILVALLRTVARGQLSTVEVEHLRHSLRKRLERSGLTGPVIGGFELVYRAGTKEWVLHVNLVAFGADARSLNRLQESFASSDTYRPVQKVALTNPEEQLSYILKFTTYHRPYQQRGAKKSPARPLNPADHLELVRWMAQYEFSDFLFLYNARRYGAAIKLSIMDA